MRRRARSRWLGHVALLPAAAFAVHQLRYYLAYGGKAGIVLARTGHSYLHSLVPWIVLVVALVVGGFLRSLGRALAGHTSLPRYSVSLAGMWLVCSLSLVAIFVCQEFLGGPVRGRPPGGAGGDFRLRRMVVDSRCTLRRAGARGLAARGSLGPAGDRHAAVASAGGVRRAGDRLAAAKRRGPRRPGAARRGLVGSGSAGVS